MHQAPRPPSRSSSKSFQLMLWLCKPYTGTVSVKVVFGLMLSNAGFRKLAGLGALPKFAACML